MKTLRIMIYVILLAIGLLTVRSADAGWPQPRWYSWGRWWGYGWSDGYHARSGHRAVPMPVWSPSQGQYPAYAEEFMTGWKPIPHMTGWKPIPQQIPGTSAPEFLPTPDTQ